MTTQQNDEEHPHISKQLLDHLAKAYPVVHMPLRSRTEPLSDFQQGYEQGICEVVRHLQTIADAQSNP